MLNEGPRPATDATAAREYLALREGVALVDLRQLSVLESKGSARARLLQGMLTNDVAALPVDGWCRAALLEARGTVVALVRVVATPDALLLEVDRERLPRLLAVLEHHRVAAPVRFATLPTVVVGVVGPRSTSVLARLTGLSALGPGSVAFDASIGGSPVRLIPAPDLGPSGWVMYVSPEAAGHVQAGLVALGALPVERSALNAVRVELGIPWWGSEVTEGRLLHETGLVRDLCSSTKGCYLGQEIVARLEARGARVNRALRALRSSHPLAPGAEVQVGSKAVGVVTTAGISPRLGPVAMALIHRDHFAAGTAVTVLGQEATVALLPLDPVIHRGADR